ncbi:MAG: hypothetical protein OEL75_02530, partial [Kiritimatiellaceae bacterium]|nr:hypothetical protein [Kiritimatiellaceae bacterium]
IINFALLMLSFALMTLAKEWIYKIHTRWFNLPKETFDTVLYCFLGLHKLLVWVFCIIPWIALSITG